MNKGIFWAGVAALGFYFATKNKANTAPLTPPYKPYNQIPQYPSTQPYTPPNGGGLVDNIEAVLDDLSDVIDSADNLFGGDKEPVKDQARPQYYDAYEDTGLPNDTIA